MSRWDATAGQLLSTIELDSTNSFTDFSAATRDGDRLALANAERIEIFGTRTGRCLDRFKSPVQRRNLEFSPDGQLLAICDWQGGNVV